MGGSSSKYPDSREVATTTGPVVGRRFFATGDKPVDAFQGIPYAKPPIGDLRFRKPEAHEPWTEVRECKAFGNRGMQTTNIYEKYKYGPVSEDNLFLNVYTPTWSPPTGDAFPVMLFIHGGGFVSDSTVKYGDERVSHYLVKKDVVVVTAQYRLGFLGFWTTGDDHCTDNVALWDMRAVLLWVQENIRNFNGDPGNVTLFGQSAGGASVDLLSISPHTRDLFHKVIPMAGNASALWAIKDEAVEACRRWARDHLKIDDEGKTKEFVDKLRQQPAGKFATGLVIPPPKDGAKPLSLTIGPRIDGSFFPAPLRELRREAKPKPRMVGCCRYEGILMILGNKTATIDRFETTIASLVPESVKDFKRKREELLKLYDHPDRTLALIELFSDIFLNISCLQYVHDWTEAGQNEVYLYSFDYFNEKSWGPLGWLLPLKGATHCTELAYIFGVGIVYDFTFNERDNEMAERTSTLWSNFAKTGNPNEGLPSPLPFKWEPATKDAPEKNLALDYEPQMRDVWHAGRPAKWAEVLRGE